MKKIAVIASFLIAFLFASSGAIAAGGFVSRTLHWKQQTTVYVDSQSYKVSGTTLDGYFRYYVNTYYPSVLDNVYYAVDMENQIVIYQIGESSSRYVRFVDLLRFVLNCEEDEY